MLLTPTTELAAVNALLATIEEAPVNSVTDTQDPDVSAALWHLTSASRGLQANGWTFNTEAGYVLNPGFDGTVRVPENAVRVTGEDRRVTLRGGRLYDQTDRTYTFAGPVTVTYVSLLPFEDLPEQARAYILAVARATLIAERNYDDLSLRSANRAVQSAWVDFHAYDTEEQAGAFSWSDAIQNRPRLTR